MMASQRARSPFFPLLPILALLVGCGGTQTEAAETVAAEGDAPYVAIPNAKTPLPGLLTGGRPSEGNLEEARDAGYRTVVSLLTEEEMSGAGEASTVEFYGMRYVNIPVAGADGLTEEAARALAEVLNDRAAYPVLLHCASGNRSGALLALKAYYVDGLPADEALALGRAAGMTTLEETVRGLMGL